MLNVVFYSEPKTKSRTYYEYDGTGTKTQVTITQIYHEIESFACETMTSGKTFLKDCDLIPQFKGDMISLSNGQSMFENSSITSVGGRNEDAADFSSVTLGSKMFANCPNLSTVNIRLDSLTDGRDMFRGCPLSQFNCRTRNLNDATRMFYNCTKLTNFTGDFSQVEYMDDAFYMAGTQVVVETGVVGLRTFSCESLDNVTTAKNAFYGAGFANWTYKMPKLINGSNMFNTANGMVYFYSDLASLTDGTNMFFKCKKLSSFRANLGSLQSGNGMFGQCILNPQSVMNIIESIPHYTEGSHPLTLGIGCSSDLSALDTFAKEAGYETWANLKSYVSSKGWTVTWTNSSFNTITI